MKYHYSSITSEIEPCQAQKQCHYANSLKELQGMADYTKEALENMENSLELALGKNNAQRNFTINALDWVSKINLKYYYSSKSGEYKSVIDPFTTNPICIPEDDLADEILSVIKSDDCLTSDVNGYYDLIDENSNQMYDDDFYSTLVEYMTDGDDQYELPNIGDYMIIVGQDSPKIVDSNTGDRYYAYELEAEDQYDRFIADVERIRGKLINLLEEHPDTIVNNIKKSVPSFKHKGRIYYML